MTSGEELYIGTQRARFGLVGVEFGILSAAATVSPGLLVQFTINGTVHYLSDVGKALTHMWKEKVIGFDFPSRSIPYDYGGYCKMSFGSIQFAPDLFENDWPPPINGALTISYTETTEAAAETVFTGIAHRTSINPESINYNLYALDYDETIADSMAYSDTLNNVLDTILTGIAEISTLDTTYARSSSPAVVYTTSGEQLAINLASEMAAFFGHMFYIDGSTAYLIDMLEYKGTRSLTEFDFFFNVPIENNIPTASASAGIYTRTSSYPYGNEMSLTAFHDTESNINTALDNILTIMNKPRAVVQLPFSSTSLPTPGTQISWTDTAQGQDVDVSICARIFRYDFSNRIVEIEGDGSIA